MCNAKGQPEAKPALTALKGQILSRSAIVAIHRAPRYRGFTAFFSRQHHQLNWAFVSLGGGLLISLGSWELLGPEMR